MIRDSKEGKLLVAHPGLSEKDFFYRSVIFIYQDNEDGTFGLVLNKQSKTSVKEVLYDKGILWPDGINLMYKGGPVSTSSVILVHTDDWQSTNTMHVPGTQYSVSSDELMFLKMSDGNQPIYWRMTTGVAAWQPGQLQLELNGKFPYKPENSWLICEPNDATMFIYDGEDQWIKATELASQQMINSYF